MSYPKISSEQSEKKAEEWGVFDISDAISILKDFPNNQVTSELVAGASGETVDDYCFIAPTEMQIKSVKFTTTAVNTGTGNTPTVSLRNATKNVEVGNTGAIALDGAAVGDVAAMVLSSTPANLQADDNQKFIFRIVNPAGTITTPLKGKLQIEWYSIEKLD